MPQVLSRGLYDAQFALTMGLLFLIGLGIKKRDRSLFAFVMPILVAWLFITAALAKQNILANFAATPPPFALAIAAQMAFLIWFIFFSKWRDNLIWFPQSQLIGLQTFRIVVEIILAELAAQSLFPKELTFHGINFDIITGLLAIPAYVAIKKMGDQKSKAIVLTFNILGLALLANIVAHSVLAAPTALQHFYYGVDTRIVGTFPMQWLPYFLVPLALSLHLISLRKLLND